MGDFSYKIEAKITPSGAVPGDRVTATVKFSHVIGEIGAVYFLMTKYGLYEKLNRVDDMTYTLEYVIPPMVPPQTYKIYFYARDINFINGPSVAVCYEVKSMGTGMM